MPFNSGGQTYQGGNYLFQGLSNVGQGIGVGVEKYQEAQKEQAANQLIIDYALKNNLLSPEEHTQYLQGSANQKNGIVAGLTRTLALDMQRQNQEALKEQRAAQAELRQQQAAAFNWTPSEAAQQLARGTGNELIPTGPGKYQLAPYGGADGSMWNPSGKAVFVTDPSGSVVGRQIQTGPNQSTFLAGTGNLEVKQDPKTKALFYREGKVWKPLSEQAIMAGQMMPSPSPTPTPQTGSKVGGIYDMIQNFLVNTGIGRRPSAAAAATPTPTPAAAEPVDTGTEPVVAATPKKLDQATAMEFLRQAGGDKAKARQLAQAAGYTF